MDQKIEWQEPRELQKQQYIKYDRAFAPIKLFRIGLILLTLSVTGIFVYQKTIHRSATIQPLEPIVVMDNSQSIDASQPSDMDQLDRSLDDLQTKVDGLMSIVTPLLVKRSLLNTTPDPLFLFRGQISRTEDEDGVDNDNIVTPAIESVLDEGDDDLIAPVTVSEVVPVDTKIAADKLNEALVKKVTEYIAVMNQKLNEEIVGNMARAIVKHAEAFDVPIDIVVGITHVESNFRPAVSGPQTKYGRALGPMQVMYSVHSGLLTKVGITDSSQVLTSDGGVKAGCFIFSRYLHEEKSVTAALARYFSKLSSDYILKKVMSSALTFSQFEAGKIDVATILTAHAKERSTMAMLIGRPAAPSKPSGGSKSPRPKGRRTATHVTQSFKGNSYARITFATPPRGTIVYKAPSSK